MAVVTGLVLITALPTRAAQCGDSICEGQETCAVCSADCGACPTPSPTPSTTPTPTAATPIPVAVTVYIQQGTTGTTPQPTPAPTQSSLSLPVPTATPITTAIVDSDSETEPIVLGDQTTEVVFGSDSLTSGKKALRLILPPDPGAQIDLNFSALFKTNGARSKIDLPQAISLERGTADGKIVVQIAENTSLSASDRCTSAWDGKITASQE